MLTVEANGPVTTITLNRPEVRNALSDHLIAALTEAFRGVSTETRAIVLTGADPAFCAGGDLEWMKRAASYTTEENIADALKLAELFQAIATCKPIVVARVNGHAFGGGAGLVACCDAAVMAPKALMSFSEVKLGLIAATISRFVVPKIGQGHARHLFSTGEVFGADHALRIGMVHAVGDDLDDLVNAKLKAILAAGPESAYASKMLAQDPALEPDVGARLLAERRATAEAKEGISAFLEKRKASFVVEP
ncbi:MAG: enoyl-CoA hydratase/isomerase family protein [Chthonomonas sp.]|nr:enoyl-CoA hydratase/isomerase family protein [Chthonomonas sp.]